MNIETLRGLVKIVELGTLSRAAEALLIAQPALSRRINKLEQDLKQPIFVREGRYLKLTPFGHQVVSRARVILQNVDILRIIGDENKSKPIIRIGASLTTISSFFLQQAISHFRNTMPNVDLVIQTGLSQDIYDFVLEGKIDIGFVSSPRNEPFVINQTLFVDRLWVICPNNHPLSNLSIISPKDLQEVPLITMTDRASLRQDLNSIFASNNVEMKVCMEIDNVGVMQTMVTAGLGVSIIPGSARVILLNLTAIPFIVSEPWLLEKTLRPFSLIHLEKPLSPVIQSWINICHIVTNQSAMNESISI
ncbi:LysR family transcriptional regulator [Neobacillus niacini]|uniref:LysR family transcriptional regulator n=1 Tax=Neobacillus niacini TaxID=86668 RepID=UPI003000DF62